MPKQCIAEHFLVTMHTFFARRRSACRSPIGRVLIARARARLRPIRRSLASETGDTLIEVIVSALLVALIVVGTFSGLDSTNKATALQRARSQADALAQQDEEQLRSEPVAKLSELNRTHTVTEGGTTYTITSTSKYIADATATASCTSSSEKADYLQTASTVTWKSLGVGKPVEETGIISPPADSALIVQVQYSGTALPGALVVAEGPSPASTSYKLETSSNGCAILAVPPGEYNIYVSKTGYVDPNGKKNTYEDSSTTRKVYIPAENTSKVGYNLGLAGTLAVSFTGSSPAEGDSFVAFNTGQTTFRPFPELFTPGSYSTTVTSPPTIFPFTTKYTIYAGTCEADLPSANGVPLVAAEEKEVTPGSTTTATVRLGPVKIKVMSGTGSGSTNEGTVVETATGSTIDGCGAKRSFTSTPSGALSHPGLPFGKYTMCVSNGGRKWEGKFENNTTTGPSSTTWTNGHTSGGVATIYLGTSPSSPEPAETSSGTCP
jgi:Tfp pilus assembly protein PilV